MQVAEKSLRFVNLIIDIIAILAIDFGIAIIFYYFNPDLADENDLTLDVIGYIIYILYYFFFEFTSGRTIGKLVTKTVVVDQFGMKPTTGKILGRTFARIIPFDALTFLFSSGGLHDNISKTCVVPTRSLVNDLHPQVYQED